MSILPVMSTLPELNGLERKLLILALTLAKSSIIYLNESRDYQSRYQKIMIVRADIYYGLPDDTK